MRRSSSATGYPWPPWGALAPPATAGGLVAVGAVFCVFAGAVFAGVFAGAAVVPPCPVPALAGAAPPVAGAVAALAPLAAGV
jgi:hypothetical protein